MPTWGEEWDRGFYLRNGGYYFAINDYVDLQLTGDIYTKGSWGVQAQSNYRKRYRYSGSINASYIKTRRATRWRVTLPRQATSRYVGATNKTLRPTPIGLSLPMSTSPPVRTTTTIWMGYIIRLYWVRIPKAPVSALANASPIALGASLPLWISTKGLATKRYQ